MCLAPQIVGDRFRVTVEGLTVEVGRGTVLVTGTGLPVLAYERL